MKKSKLKEIIVFSVYIALILLLTIVIIDKKSQNDLFFDIKTGESILKYGIDFKDHFSFIPNLTYLYHHYLYDLIIYGIYHTFSYKGIFIFFLIICSLMGLILFKVNYSYSKSKFLSFFVTLVTLLIMGTYMSNRVQTVTYLLFFLEVYFLNKLYDTGEKKYTLFLFLISLTIANIHMPMWILTLVFTLPFLGEYLISKFTLIKEFISKKIIIKKPKNTKIFLVTIGILLLTGLLSPLKLNPYTFFLKAIGNEDFLFIAEMGQTVFIKYKYTLFLFCLAIVLLSFLKTKFKLRDLFLLIGLFLFSTIAFRNIAYVYLFYPTVCYKIINENFDFTKIDINFILDFINKYLNLTIFSVFFLIAIIIIYGFCFKEIDIAHFDYNISEDYPVKTVKYIKENLDYKNIKMYNEFNFGSYLEFNDIPVFIDSRAEVYIKAFNGGKDIVNDFLDVKYYQKYKWIFQKYKFQYVLTYSNNDLYAYLVKDKDFEAIYTENKYVLFKCNL